MGAADLLHKIGEMLGSTATVKSVFGEPIEAHGKTVVPIAKIAYGFGGGFGGAKGNATASREGEAGGGGGGVRAFPAGAMEITDSGTRFVPFVDLRLVAVVFAAGILVGSVGLRRREIG